MKKSFLLFALVTLVLLLWGAYQALAVAPTEATMGDIQRIFYYHFPSAIVAFTLFTVNLVASIVYLMKRTRGSDALAVSTAEVGVAFCSVVLVTGPLWAKPVWGIWWTWDARLTSTLVLWLIYVSYLVLRRFATGSQTSVIAAALAVFGYVDVPFVYLANRLFRTQHPQPVIGGDASSGLAPSMWGPVWWNMAAFTCFAILLVWMRYRLEHLRHELNDAQLAMLDVIPEDAKVTR